MESASKERHKNLAERMAERDEILHDALSALKADVEKNRLEIDKVKRYQHVTHGIAVAIGGFFTWAGLPAIGNAISKLGGG